MGIFEKGDRLLEDEDTYQVLANDFCQGFWIAVKLFLKGLA